MRKLFFRATLFCVVVGAALQAWVLLAGGWPTFLPLLLVAWALPFLLWSVHLRRRAAAAGSSRGSRAALVGLVLLCAGPVVYDLVTDVTTHVVRPMTWSSQFVDDAVQVTLRFADAPDRWWIRIPSPQLAAYLAGLNSRTVDVEFELSSDFGRVAAFHIVRVEDLGMLGSPRVVTGCTDGPCTWPW